MYNVMFHVIVVEQTKEVNFFWKIRDFFYGRLLFASRIFASEHRDIGSFLPENYKALS